MTSCKDIHSTDLLKEEWEWTDKLGSSQKSKLRVLGLGAGQFGWKEVTDSKGYVDNRFGQELTLTLGEDGKLNSLRLKTHLSSGAFKEVCFCQQ